MPNMPDKTPVPTPATALNTIRQRSDIPAEATLRFVASDVSLRGVYVPLITPFAPDGTVALDALDALAHTYLDAGVAGLVPLGTTGETPLLDHDEQAAVVDVCARVCRERHAPMIVGTGTNSTRSTIAATQALAAIPETTAALCVVPYYLRPGQAGIVAHFEAIAAASPVPVVIYNIPGRTGRLLEPDGLLRLANTANIVGVKQAVGAVDDGSLRLLAEAPPGFAVLGGDDAFMFPLVLLGAAGAISAAAHVCTRRFVEMTECGLAGKVDEGRAHHDALLAVSRACFAEPNPAVFKGVLHAQGLIATPDVRLPLTNASPEAVRRAVDAVDAAGG
jgi:4-hydroxy-tetrahydrodipicolinate synthase